jgi:hypothetical protein
VKAAALTDLSQNSGQGHEPLERGCRSLVAVAVDDQVTVHHCDGLVPEPLGGDLDRHTRFREQRGVSVPEVVETNQGHAARRTRSRNAVPKFHGVNVVPSGRANTSASSSCAARERVSRHAALLDANEGSRRAWRILRWSGSRRALALLKNKPSRVCASDRESVTVPASRSSSDRRSARTSPRRALV